MTKEDKILPFICYASLFSICLALIPWLTTFLSQAINSDISYLTLSAGRMLSGEAMSKAYYDTTLPLSIIAQTPAIILSKLTPIPLYYAISIYSLSLLCLSVFATNSLLKYFKDIKIEQRYVILCVYIVTNTITTNYDFGQKDHILGMAIFPLILAQLLITQRIELNTVLKWAVIIAGSFFILLKPHYGLIPAAIFIHRIAVQRRISIVFDLDFLWLAGMAIAYVCAILLFFNDFASVIMPDVLKYYSSDISTRVIYTGVILMFQAIVPLFICQLFLKKPPALVSAFSIMAVLCLIPFIMQGKGWDYHSIPAKVFFYNSIGLILSFLISRSLVTLKANTVARYAGLLTVIGALLYLISSSNYTKQPNTMPTHSSYKNSEFVKIINECKGDCSFLLFHDTINIAHELSVYTGKTQASRFPYLWFVPSLLNSENNLLGNRPSALSQEDLDTATNKYTTMIAEDFKKYDPDVLLIGHISYNSESSTTFNAKSYLLEKSPELFEPIWESYELEKTIMVDRLDYMIAKFPDEDLIRYDIYKKKEKTNNE